MAESDLDRLWREANAEIDAYMAWMDEQPEGAPLEGPEFDKCQAAMRAFTAECERLAWNL